LYANRSWSQKQKSEQSGVQFTKLMQKNNSGLTFIECQQFQIYQTPQGKVAIQCLCGENYFNAFMHNSFVTTILKE